MASFLDSLMGLGGAVAKVPFDFIQGAYESTPQGARQLEEQKQMQKAAEINRILGQSSGQLSQEQLAALGALSPEFTQARLSALIPKPLGAANLEFNPVTGEAYTTQYNPNAQQLEIRPYGGAQPQQQLVVPAGMPQPVATGKPDPTSGMLPKAKMEYQQKMAGLQAEKEAAAPKVLQSFANSEAQVGRFMQVLQDVKKQASDPAATGFAGQVLRNIGGTRANDLGAKTLIAEANNFVNALAEMKSLSPTGASGLGSLTENEGKKIQSKIANLDTTQTGKQLQSQIDDLGKAILESRKIVKNAIVQEYGKDALDKYMPQQVDSKPDTSQPPIAGARQAPDGNWYVQQNGRYYKVEQ